MDWRKQNQEDDFFNHFQVCSYSRYEESMLQKPDFQVKITSNIWLQNGVRSVQATFK